MQEKGGGGMTDEQSRRARLISEPVSLEVINDYLELQEGRCVMCRELFAHCGGRVELVIHCQCCFSREEGLLCVECSDRRRTRSKC